MGYAAYRAWTTGTQSIDPRKVTLAQQGATLYTIQLALNLIWMPLFFKFRRPIEATADIVALTGITGYMAYIWNEVDEVATYAILPYLGWLTYATYLSVSFVHSMLVGSEVLTFAQAGAGYLNDWDFNSKEMPKPPSTKSSETNMVNEVPKNR